LQYNGSIIAGFDATRTLTMANRMRVTAGSTISYASTTLNLLNASLSDGGHNITFNFTHDQIDRTGGTLTFQNDGVCTSGPGGAGTNTCVFRPTFSGAFNYTGPVVINDQIDDASTGRVSTRGTVLQSTASGTQTWSGVISGTGDFLRGGGGGTTILTANNSYTGDTIVQAGTLSITNPYLANAADVYLTTGSTFNLNFAGTDTIDQLFIDGTSVGITGTWGAPGSGAANETALITGTGMLNVSTPGSSPGAVPEPGTLALAMMTIFAFSAGHRRRA
jgi:autotransporter-associated beta strand protein